MDAKYIHTEQLLNSKREIETNLYPLKTHIAYTLFGQKDNISPFIATVEAKARMLITHYGLSAEQVVERISQFLLLSLVRYIEGQRTLKSFLLQGINQSLDRMMSDLRRKETFHVPKSVRKYREMEQDSELFGQQHDSGARNEDLEIFDGIETKKPVLQQSKKPTVVVRRRNTEPEVRTYVDFYDNDF